MIDKLIIELGKAELCECDRLFPLALEQDPWVAYHATSSLFEEEIDAGGLSWQAGSYSRDEVETIVQIFESMQWVGVHHGGFGVLKPFSLTSDFGEGDQKPIFLREDSLRSPIYATRDFSGGETARAIRHCIEDLDLYLADESVREQHYRYLQRQAEDHCLSEESVKPVDLGWLNENIETLTPIRSRTFSLLNDYRYGLVYAVRFKHADLPRLKYSSHMGIKCFGSIKPKQIVGKAMLLADDEIIRNVSSNVDFRSRRARLFAQPDGLLNHLKEALRTPE